MRTLQAVVLLNAVTGSTAASWSPVDVNDYVRMHNSDESRPLHQNALGTEKSTRPSTNQAGSLDSDPSDTVLRNLEGMSPQVPLKAHTRKHDAEWDYMIRGIDIVDTLTVDLAEELSTYSLRTKSVNPGSLNVDSVKQYSGYLDDEDHDKHLFYWFFESRNDPEHDPVVLWLNGGPGGSSMTGLFLELGPSSINSNLKLVYNPFSWNANASVIFLDQPVNVGFSYAGNLSFVGDTVAASKDVYALLTLFFDQFPQYAELDFHIAGESYGGHYVPVFAHEILSHKERNINLQSILIGNGLTDPLTQYEYYRPMACGNGGWPSVLSEPECQSMDNALPRCKSLIKRCYNDEDVSSCVSAEAYCNNAILRPYQRTGQNMYDVRSPCELSGELCYTVEGFINDYLNQKEVMHALGVEVSSFGTMNDTVHEGFLKTGDWMKPFHRVVPHLLAEIAVLVYAGDADFVCNWLGNRAWAEALEWSGKKAYNEAQERPLMNDLKEVTGSIKNSGNLTFIRLHAAGHMVPYNQPLNSLDMFNRWIMKDLDT